MSAATEGFSAMISVFVMGGGCEERQIVPKSMRREQINLRLKHANARALCAGALARARERDDMTTRFLRPLLPEPARHRRGAAGELECEQRCSDDFRVKAASRDQRVDGGRRVAEDCDHATLVGGEVVLGGDRLGCE